MKVIQNWARRVLTHMLALLFGSLIVLLFWLVCRLFGLEPTPVAVAELHEFTQVQIDRAGTYLAYRTMAGWPGACPGFLNR